jgi:hypothetical protein
VDRAFEAARKAERARPALEERLNEIKGLLARAEAGEALPESLPVSRKGKPQEPRKAYKVFLSADGRRILVGKGGKDNDETRWVAGPADFLHAGCPGARDRPPGGGRRSPSRPSTPPRLRSTAECGRPRDHLHLPARAEAQGAKPGLIREGEGPEARRGRLPGC